MKTVAFYSSKGGVGVSWMCYELAKTLHRYLRVRVMGIGGPLYPSLDDNPWWGNVKIDAKSVSRFDEPIVVTDKIINVLAGMNDRTELLILDCSTSSGNVLALLVSLRLINLVVVPFTSDPLAIIDTKITFELLAGIGCQPMLIYNMARSSDEDCRNRFDKKEKLALSPIIMPYFCSMVDVGDIIIKAISERIDSEKDITPMPLLGIPRMSKCQKLKSALPNFYEYRLDYVREQGGMSESDSKEVLESPVSRCKS